MFIKSRGLGLVLLSVHTAKWQTRAVLVTRDRYTGSGWLLSRRVAQLKCLLLDQRGLAPAIRSKQNWVKRGRGHDVTGGLRNWRMKGHANVRDRCGRRAMALLLGFCHDGTWLLGSKVLTSLPAGLSAWLRNAGTLPGVAWPPFR